MPEGDTIYRTARTLNRALAGQVVTGFETGLVGLAAVDDESPVTGRTVEKVESRGKWCLIYFSGDLILATHMLMSGSWHLYRPGERWQRPRRSMRIVIRRAGWEAVAFDVQVAKFHTARSIERDVQIAKLGPDVLSAAFTVEKGVERLHEYAKGHPEAPVGEVLMNQRVIAGLGNVYKSEVAFSAEVHPFRAVGTLMREEMERLMEFASRYMRANVEEGTDSGVTTYVGNRRTTGRIDREERLWVYKRMGEECRRCGGTIVMRRQGTQARSSYWCPRCQPWTGTGEPPEGYSSRRRDT
jgi:endonuclease-8